MRPLISRTLCNCISVYRCKGFPFNECNNAGDCSIVDGIGAQCVCDEGFSGENCESKQQVYKNCTKKHFDFSVRVWPTPAQSF